jgi:hypothetical protein
MAELEKDELAPEDIQKARDLIEKAKANPEKYYRRQSPISNNTPERERYSG